jgi:hypothetical protein
MITTTIEPESLPGTKWEEKIFKKFGVLSPPPLLFDRYGNPSYNN